MVKERMQEMIDWVPGTNLSQWVIQYLRILAMEFN